MTLHYLDSSAWVKRYFEEPGSDWVDTLFEENHILSSSTLGLIEVTATAARKCGAGSNAVRLAEIQKDLLDDWGHFLWVDLASEVVERSVAVALALALRGSDSVHLASALQLRDDLGVNVNEFTFVTSDHELKAAALKSGLTVLDPQEKTIH
jgi:predicted nucleic acid-binding protein